MNGLYNLLPVLSYIKAQIVQNKTSQTPTQALSFFNISIISNK